MQRSHHFQSRSSINLVNDNCGYRIVGWAHFKRQDCMIWLSTITPFICSTAGSKTVGVTVYITCMYNVILRGLSDLSPIHTTRSNGPSERAVRTARSDGSCFFTPVRTARSNGCRYTLPVWTARSDGPFERVVCIGLNGPSNKKALQTMFFSERAKKAPVRTGRSNGPFGRPVRTAAGTHYPFKRPVRTGSVYRALVILINSLNRVHIFYSSFLIFVGTQSAAVLSTSSAMQQSRFFFTFHFPGHADTLILVFGNQWCSPRGNCLVLRHLETVSVAPSLPQPWAFSLGFALSSKKVTHVGLHHC